MNLIISGSQQNGTEENLIRPIAERLYQVLKDEALVNPVLLPLYDGNDEAALYHAIQASNAFCGDNGDYTGLNSRHFPIHADGGYNATGASGLYYSEAGKQFITPILEGIMAVTPWADVGLRRRTDLGELKNTVAVAGLLEISFYDHPDELAWMQANTELLAQTMRKGIYQAVNIPMPIPSIDYEAKYNELLQQYYSMKREVQEVINKYL